MGEVEACSPRTVCGAVWSQRPRLPCSVAGVSGLWQWA